MSKTQEDQFTLTPKKNERLLCYNRMGLFEMLLESKDRGEKIEIIRHLLSDDEWVVKQYAIISEQLEKLRQEPKDTATYTIAISIKRAEIWGGYVVAEVCVTVNGTDKTTVTAYEIK